MTKELITLEAVKEAGNALTTVTTVAKGVGNLVSYQKEKNFNAKLTKIEKETAIKMAKDRGDQIRIMQQIENVKETYDLVDSIPNPRTRKVCEELAYGLVKNYKKSN